MAAGPLSVAIRRLPTGVNPGTIEIRRGRRALETLVEPCLELARMALDHVEVRLPPGREPPASLQGIGHGHLDAGAP
jgi:hypothetical protein